LALLWLACGRSARIPQAFFESDKRICMKGLIILGYFCDWISFIFYLSKCIFSRERSSTGSNDCFVVVVVLVVVVLVVFYPLVI
jgi:hypothetical protein